MVGTNLPIVLSLYIFFIEIVVATNAVWNDISIFLNGAISKNALHVFVYNGRHGIKKALNLITNEDANTCMALSDPMVLSNESGIVEFIH